MRKLLSRGHNHDKPNGTLQPSRCCHSFRPRFVGSEVHFVHPVEAGAIVVVVFCVSFFSYLMRFHLW